MGINLQNGRTPKDLADAIVNVALALGSPTDGEFAAWLWRLLSSGNMDGLWANNVYSRCGYVPFQGYPLRRLPDGPRSVKYVPKRLAINPAAPTPQDAVAPNGWAFTVHCSQHPEEMPLRTFVGEGAKERAYAFAVALKKATLDLAERPEAMETQREYDLQTGQVLRDLIASPAFQAAIRDYESPFALHLNSIAAGLGGQGMVVLHPLEHALTFDKDFEFWVQATPLG